MTWRRNCTGRCRWRTGSTHFGDGRHGCPMGCPAAGMRSSKRSWSPPGRRVLVATSSRSLAHTSAGGPICPEERFDLGTLTVARAGRRATYSRMQHHAQLYTHHTRVYTYPRVAVRACMQVRSCVPSVPPSAVSRRRAPTAWAGGIAGGDNTLEYSYPPGLHIG